MDENENELLEAKAENTAVAENTAAQEKPEAAQEKEHKLELNGMHCESCERLVRRAAEKAGAEVKQVNAGEGFVTFSCDEGVLPALKKALLAKGFTEKGSEEVGRGDINRVKEYAVAVMENREDVEVENALLNYSLGSFAMLVLIAAALYLFVLQGIENIAGYAQLFLLAIGSAVVLSFSYHHLGTYRRAMSCTNGMMAGMTLGMMGGFLVGALVGATNGMFVGSLAGMLAGIALGVGIGRHCGVMGALEGGMAGIMAGTMGAMLSVMMVNDHLLAFLYVLFALCAGVLGGLSYMMHREAAEVPKKSDLKASFSEFAGFCAVMVLALMLLMTLGPKAGFIYP
ncbi:MAG: heavy metal-associated domain-containing protein [Candidatus Micrarchaeia archaeon]